MCYTARTTTTLCLSVSISLPLSLIISLSLCPWSIHCSLTLHCLVLHYIIPPSPPFILSSPASSTTPFHTILPLLSSPCLIHYVTPPLSGNHESLGPMGGSSPFGPRDGTGTSKETWNLNLYHGGSVLSEGELLEGKRACFDCLLKQILAVRGTPGNIGGAVIVPGDEVCEPCYALGPFVCCLNLHSLSFFFCSLPLRLSLCVCVWVRQCVIFSV